MSASFKIPKKRQPEVSDSSHFHVQSPLSRLQSSAPQVKGYEDFCSRGALRRWHGGGAPSLAAGRDRPLFRDVVKTLLGLNSPSGGGVSAANHWSCQSQAKGWRPKRASGRLLQPDGEPQQLPPPQRTGEKGVALPLSKVSVDSLAELRATGHDGNLSSSSLQTRGDPTAGTNEELRDSAQPQSIGSGPENCEDRVTSPTRTRIRIRLSAASPLLGVGRARPDRRRSLDVAEAQRERWRRFREGRGSTSRPKKPRVAPAEPIVLSSEEEEEESGRRGLREDGAEALRVSLQPPPPVTPPTFLQLQFSCLHVGLMRAHANGAAMVTEDAITLPVTGADDGQLVVVASQVWGYGLWDGGVAQGGTLLEGWVGPAPSLLLLWVSNAQANMLHRELAALQMSGAATGPPCPVLLLVLTEQLHELQAALLASILDLQNYQQGRSSHGGPASPLDWADGLTLVHSCPSPVDQHLLRLLGRSAESGQLKSSPRNGSKEGLPDLQHLPSRLVQYPLFPCKGRITVTREDLDCLHAGEFLNDVIIDFYLKYLIVEGVSSAVADRTHIFSSFFFRQLSRRRTAVEDEGDAPSAPDRHRRHQRVKTWTRHLDIFTKDFLFVPVNQDSHWFLAVVCFPGLEEPCQEQHQSEPAGQMISLQSAQPPDCTLRGCSRRTVMKRPCILVMDSLKTCSHDGVCRLLRDYLQVEWEVRRGTPRLFSTDRMKGFSCRVPQQDNSSDCGVFLLQFAHSFLQNPVVNFEIPPRLENWFSRQQVRQKREEIRNLILELHQNQLSWE